MSLVRRSLSFSILHLSCGFKQHREFAGASWLRTYSSKQPLRVANVGAGHGETAAIAAQPYPSREFELSSEIEQQASVALNEVAPPVSNVFGSARKEVSIFEDPAGFFRNRAERKVEKVKQALQSVEEAVAPSAFSPTQGDDVVGFFLISVFLILLFWVGNYLAPTWIFKETVFRISKENSDDNVEECRQDDEPSEEVDPADFIELPTNLQPFRGIVVEGFKAGRERARQQAGEKLRKKRPGKSK